ncbi:MAG TPA: hypothetical protein VFL67_04860 [Mycobacterium sp.]|nr:hypothetical protein [Mycobacterium sp.]
MTMWAQSNSRAGSVLRLGASVLVAVGAAQLVGLALAFSRILDPGPATFDAIGLMSGIGMGATALFLQASIRSRHPQRVALLVAAPNDTAGP